MLLLGLLVAHAVFVHREGNSVTEFLLFPLNSEANGLSQPVSAPLLTVTYVLSWSHEIIVYPIIDNICTLLLACRGRYH